jgi:heparan-alpha-glucosaminide N-acetyltransferase
MFSASITASRSKNTLAGRNTDPQEAERTDMEIPAAPNERIVSIDILRGLTILVMVFVNDLASVKGLPWWTYHMPAGRNGMTYVDVVFPAFLFIVGMAIPLAFQKRFAGGDSIFMLCKHIFLRSVGLVVIGLLIMNGRDMNPETTQMGYALWNVLMFTGVMFFWNTVPKNSNLNPNIFKILKWLGLIILVVLLALYKRKVNGETKWLNLTNWSILGSIGWSYMASCIIYLLFRKRVWAVFAAFLVLNLMHVAESAGWISFFRKIPPILWPFRNGALASITVSGMLMSLIFAQDTVFKTLREKILRASAFTMILFALGFALLPFGVAKRGATPSWCLLSSGIVSVLFLLIYWLADVRKYRKWAGFMKPAGSNPLLTYLLPDIFYAIFGLNYLDQVMGTGLLGAARSLLFALFILSVSAVLTRLKIRLQL